VGRTGRGALVINENEAGSADELARLNRASFRYRRELFDDLLKLKEYGDTGNG
jgi:hypothetical protein